MIKFNHEKKSVHASLGIAEEKAHRITGSVLYEMINQEQLIFRLFSDPKEAPRNLTTKTGILENIFDNDIVKTEQERLFATWEFCKMDSLISTDTDQGQNLQKVMGFLFATSKGDKEEFIDKFIEMRNK